MTQDITRFDETGQKEQETAPPLCLVHYFGATGQGPPMRSAGRIAARDGNLIILEFAPPPESVQARWQKNRRRERLHSRLTLPIGLLLLVCLLGCLAARF